MALKLYGMAQSHSVFSARLMLEHKRLAYVAWNITPGLHPLVVRTAGFGGWTVRALRAGRHRVQGSTPIARFLDELEPRRPLFPADPARRRAVERAERFGHDVLQPAVRRIARWAITERRPARLWLVREVIGWPAPHLIAYPLRPVAFVFARWVSGAGPARVRDDLAALPSQLDRVDELIEAGVIGGPEPNAADCQIFGSLRLLLVMRDLAPSVAPRQCGRAALELAPHFPAPPPRALPVVPEVLPKAWLPRSVAGPRGSPTRSTSGADAAIAAARTKPSVR